MDRKMACGVTTDDSINPTASCRIDGSVSMVTVKSESPFGKRNGERTTLKPNIHVPQYQANEHSNSTLDVLATLSDTNATYHPQQSATTLLNENSGHVALDGIYGRECTKSVDMYS